MSPSAALRLSVVAGWLLGLIGTVVAIILQKHLPAPLKAWLEEEAKTEPPFWIPIFIVMGLSLLGSIIGSIGLLMLRRWGAWIYLASTMSGFSLLPFIGHSIVPAGAVIFQEAAVVLCGVSIGLSFGSNALKSKSA